MKLIYLICIFILISVSVVYGTTPISVSGKPSIYDNWDTSVYEDSLVAFYRFDNESAVGENDTHVYDWTLPQNNGTVTGAIYNLTNKTLGDGAMQFDGLDDYINTNLVMTNSTPHTVSFWFKIKELDKTQTLIANANGSSITGIQYRFNNKILIYYGLEKYIYSNKVFSSADLNSWYHIAITIKNMSVSNWNLYINGVNDNGILGADTGSDNIGGSVRIGARQPALSNYFNGSIDEVMIFNRSLSASEISDIYNQTNKNQVIPYEDMSVISSVTLLKDTYTLNDTGGDGAIIIGANDITLDCNGATLRGNGTAGSNGIRSNNNNNVTIKNCIVERYEKCYRPTNGKDILLNNITANNCSFYPVHFQLTDNSTITNSTFNNNPNYVYIELSSENVYVSNNFFNDTDLRIQTGSHNSIVFNNNFYNCSTASCIYVYANNSRISYNTLNWSRWSGTIVWGINHSIFNNNFYNINTHPSIDFNNVDGGIGSINNSVYNNFITSDSTIQGIELDGTINSLFYNNTVFNTSYSIILVGENRTKNNKIYNNTFNHSTIVCVSSVGQNNITDNILDNCKTEINLQDTYPSNISYFINNNYIEGIARIDLGGIGVNLSVNETSRLYHNVTVYNNGWIKFSYNGRKDFRVENNTITINNMPTSFNQIFNQTSTTPTSENSNTFTETIPPNNRTLIFSFTTSTQPSFSNIGTNISTVEYSFKNNILEINCTGSGSVTIKNLAEIKGESGYFNYFKDGIYIDRFVDTAFTFSCSQHRFAPYNDDEGGDSGDSSSSNPSSPIYSDEPETPDFEPVINKTKGQEIAEKISNSTKNIKNFILGTIKEPKIFTEQFKSLSLIDRILAIIFSVLGIVFIVFMIWIASHNSMKNKKPKKDVFDS